MARFRMILYFLTFISISFFGCGEIKELAGTKEGVPLSVEGSATLSQAGFNAINQTRQANGRGVLALNQVVSDHAVRAAQENLQAYLNNQRGDQNIGRVDLIHSTNPPNANGVSRDQIVSPDRVQENLYATTISMSQDQMANDVVNQWLQSLSIAAVTGHCENLLYPNHHSMGVGAAVGQDSRGRQVAVISAGFVCPQNNCFRIQTPRCNQ